MTPTTFQAPELRDNLDNIIQAGAYGKKTAFCNAQNTGVLDYINNNLMYLWTNLVDEPTIDSKISAHNTDTNSHADIRTELNNKLDKSGGAMSGDITATGRQYLQLCGGNKWGDGSGLVLHNNKSIYGAGNFQLKAQDEVYRCDLVGKPDGTLTWNNQHVANNNKLSMPSQTIISLALPSVTAGGWTQNVYTAPADGYYCVNDFSAPASFRFLVSGGPLNIGYFAGGYYQANMVQNVVLPVARGTNVSIYANTPVSISSVQFIYAQSAT